MKKRRLKKEVKAVLIAIIFLTISYIFIINAFNRIERIGHMCDLEKGHACTIYEVQQYARQLGGK